MREPPALAGTSSLTGVGSRCEVLWNLACPVGLSQKECAHFSERNLAQF